jgi:short-chain fatty acids transporter
MLQRLGSVSARYANKLIPDAFVFAILLSAFIFVLGVLITPSGPAQMVGHWYSGFWNFLGFSMQMVLILLTGYVLAQSPPVRRIMARLAKVPKSGGQGIVLIAAVTLVAGFINWGLGLVVGAVLAIAVARDMKQRGIPLHFPLAAAAGYLGLSIHSTGFSSTAPLIVNTDNHFLYEQIGRVPFTDTVLTTWNLIAVAVYILFVPLLMKAMMPPAHEIKEIQLADDKEDGDDNPGHMLVEAPEDEADRPLAQRLENSRVLTAMVVVPGFGYIAYFFATKGFDLNINIVNFTFMMLGLALYQRPIAYVKAISKAASAGGGIVLQFPFYAGILGMMSLSGLIQVLAGGMIAVSNEYTFPFLAMFSAAIVNFFVPSAGGQWAIQGPILLEAGAALDVPVGITIMAHQYGDQITNMLQPFWALPLLGLTGLKAKDILGYTAVIMFFGFAVFGVAISVLPRFVG